MTRKSVIYINSVHFIGQEKLRLTDREKEREKEKERKRESERVNERQEEDKVRRERRN